MNYVEVINLHCHGELYGAHNPITCYCDMHRSAEARAHASLGHVYELLQNVDQAIDHYELVSAIKHNTRGIK